MYTYDCCLIFNRDVPTYISTNVFAKLFVPILKVLIYLDNKVVTVTILSAKRFDLVPNQAEVFKDELEALSRQFCYNLSISNIPTKYCNNGIGWSDYIRKQ